MGADQDFSVRLCERIAQHPAEGAVIGTGADDRQISSDLFHQKNPSARATGRGPFEGSVRQMIIFGQALADDQSVQRSGASARIGISALGDQMFKP